MARVGSDRNTKNKHANRAGCVYFEDSVFLFSISSLLRDLLVKTVMMPVYRHFLVRRVIMKFP